MRHVLRRVVLCIAMFGVAGCATVGREEPIFRVGGDANAPVVIKMVAPKYPKAAIKRYAWGNVVVEVIVDKHGNVTSVHVMKSLPGFDNAVVRAVRQWKFQPGTLKSTGEEVSTAFNITVRFHLDGSGWLDE